MTTHVDLVEPRYYGLPLCLAAAFVTLQSVIIGYLAIEEFLLSLLVLILCTVMTNNSQSLGKLAILWFFYVLVLAIAKTIIVLIFHLPAVTCVQLAIVFAVPLASLGNDLFTVGRETRIREISWIINGIGFEIGVSLYLAWVKATLIQLFLLSWLGYLIEPIRVSSPVHFLVTIAVCLVFEIIGRFEVKYAIESD
jgi:hypothetical protein